MSDRSVDLRRDKFERKHIASRILSLIKKSPEGFNFLISGEWGSGKTSVLKMLEEKAESSSVKIVWFSPWKYLQGQRDFSVTKKLLFEIRKNLGHKDPALDLYEHTRFFRIAWKRLIPAFVQTIPVMMYAILLILITVFIGSLIQNNDLSLLHTRSFLAFFKINPAVTTTFKHWVILAALPFLLPLFTLVSESVRYKPSLETINLLEDSFNEYIDKSHYDKIIILVDDLDRCSEDDVKQILTSLFTVFENPKCFYVVAADCRILEPFAGAAVSRQNEDKSNEELLQTGRDYLKKIFSYVYRLPKISPARLQASAREEFVIIPEEKRQAILELITPELHFNPREIKYLIRNLELVIAVIKKEEISLKPDYRDEARRLEFVFLNPVHLAKALVIMNKWPNLWSQIEQNPNILDSPVGENPPLVRLQGEIGNDESKKKTIEIYKFEYKNAHDFLKNPPHFDDRIAPDYFIDILGAVSFNPNLSQIVETSATSPETFALQFLERIKKSEEQESVAKEIIAKIDQDLITPNFDQADSRFRSLLKVISKLSDVCIGEMIRIFYTNPDSQKKTLLTLNADPSLADFFNKIKEIAPLRIIELLRSSIQDTQQEIREIIYGLVRPLGKFVPPENTVDFVTILNDSFSVANNLTPKSKNMLADIMLSNQEIIDSNGNDTFYQTLNDFFKTAEADIENVDLKVKFMKLLKLKNRLTDGDQVRSQLIPQILGVWSTHKEFVLKELAKNDLFLPEDKNRFQEFLNLVKEYPGITLGDKKTPDFQSVINRLKPKLARRKNATKRSK